MSAGDRYRPTFSHGGASVPGWTAVSGLATGAGRPVMVWGAIDYCAMTVSVTGGNATVGIEANQGSLDSTARPPSAGWVDQSSDGLGFAVTPSAPICKVLPAPLAAFWRTNILSLDSGAQVTSYVGAITITSASGPVTVSAKYPSISTDAAAGAGEV